LHDNSKAEAVFQEEIVSPAPTRPTIALAMGDPCGISAELTAKLLVDPDVLGAADFIVIGDRRILAEGERIAGVKVDCTVWKPGSGRPATNGRILFVDLGHLAPTSVEQGVSSKAGGAFALTNFRTILRLGANGAADAVAFTPFNKHAMKQALPSYVDNLWNARVTSHVPLKDVAKYITKAAVVSGIELTDRCMREAGVAKPRIAVAGLNPHAGDGGNFGREEIDEIEPAVEAAKAKGIDCHGPYPPDTVFVRAKRGDFDAVQTMYHDQGQIAMKLMGFERGVTLIAGYGFPICTPAHGTAYDIAGKGIANPGASRNALLIAAAMAKPSEIDAAGRFQRLEAVVAKARTAA
jgi:4-hydroxythreonine-4-phosphate dehydrogenase